MKVLVVGATGALGPRVVADLLEHGHDVVATSTRPESGDEISASGAAPLILDALDAGSATRGVSAAAPEVVVNLATRIPPAGPTRVAHMKPTNRLRQVGGANLLNASIAAGARRYVGESMIFVYGFGAQSSPAREDQALEREQRRGLRDVVDALRENEDRLAEAARSGAIETVALRFGLFHSPRAESTHRMAGMLAKRRFPLISGGRAIHSWVALEDAAQAVVLAVEADDPKPVYNVVDDLPVRIADYVAELAETIGAKRPPSMPGWALRPFASYAVTFLGDVQLPVANDLLSDDLGWKPRYPTYRDVFAELADES